MFMNLGSLGQSAGVGPFRSGANQRARRWLLGGLLVLGVGHAAALGKAIVRLDPTPAGPYSPGQSVVVDVFIENLEAVDLPVTTVQLDFADTSSAISLPATLTWLLAPSGAGNASLPTPTWIEPTNTPTNIIPANGGLIVARIQITLPTASGCYALDVMNRTDSASTRGAQLAYLPLPGARADVWRAFHGQLLDGAAGFSIGSSTGAEVCDGVDNDCDGLVDEDFEVDAYNPLVDEVVSVGAGAVCVRGVGACETEGVYACNRAGTALACTAPTPPAAGVEGPYRNASCYDGHDNDCDALIDWEDPDCTGPEICDYVDNDNNGIVDDPFLGLGDECVKGQGVCAATGVLVCSRDGMSVECSADPLPTNVEFEGPPDHPRCFDGLDNDCDGLIDLADPDCQMPEVCDGQDNNGDGQVDENWPALGQLCTVGVGECQRSGVIVCNASGAGTQCSVAPGGPTPEGPGCDCGDTLDNDCDGLIDLDDPDCGAFIFRAQAALPRVCDVAGDCATWRTVDYATFNGGPVVSVTAEIVALDSNGAVLGTRLVDQGDVVHFTNRSDPAALQLNTVFGSLNTPAAISRWMSCTAGPNQPLPSSLCRPFDMDCDQDVDLADAARLQVLFPDPIRYHQVTAPIALLRVTADNGYAKVVAYASPTPHVHVWHPDESVVILNEGDRVFANVAMPEIDPTSLTLALDGVDLFAALGINPLTDFPGGPYGGSVTLPNGCTAQICELIVDAADSETLAANSLRMVVEGMCCGGHRFNVSGQPRVGALPPLSPACENDDGIDGGVSHGFEIDIIAPADGTVDPAAPVNVVGTVCHGLPLGNPPAAAAQVALNGLSVGTNPPVVTAGDGVNTADEYRYVFSASLPETNLFNDFVSGGVPGTVDPGGSYLIAGAQDAGLNAVYDQASIGLGAVTAKNLRGGDGVPHGVSLAVTDVALELVVKRALNALIPVLIEQLDNLIRQAQGSKVTIPTNAPCDPVVTILPNFPFPPVFMAPDFNNFVIDVVPQNDRLDVTITVPETRLLGSAIGRCEIEGIFGECFIEVVVSVFLDVRIKKVTVDFSASESDLISGAAIVPTITILPQDVVINISDVSSDVGCWGGTLAEILSFGIVNVVIENYVEDKINDYIADFDPQQYLGMIPVPPIPIDFLDIEPIDLGQLDVTLELRRTEVEITPNGLTVGLESEFIPRQIDPEVKLTAGSPDTPATLPHPPLGGAALGATILVSDDAVNQMLYALTRNGFIKTEYEDVQIIPNLLPNNCATLAPAFEGQCQALKGLGCGGLTGAALVSCLATSAVSDQLNIGPATPIVLHGRLDVPPKFYIFRNPSLSSLVAYFRLSQVHVGVIADRDGDGMIAQAFDALPSCYGDNPGTQTACLMWEGCFDVNVGLNMILSAPPGGTPEISFTVASVNLSQATGCGGGTAFPAGLDGLEDVFTDQVFNILESQISSVPPIKLDGLDFGNIVNLINLRVLNHGNESDPIFKDYFGITADPN